LIVSNVTHFGEIAYDNWRLQAGPANPIQREPQPAFEEKNVKIPGGMFGKKHIKFTFGEPQKSMMPGPAVTLLFLLYLFMSKLSTASAAARKTWGACLFGG